MSIGESGLDVSERMENLLRRLRLGIADAKPQAATRALPMLFLVVAMLLATACWLRPPPWPERSEVGCVRL